MSPARPSARCPEAARGLRGDRNFGSPRGGQDDLLVPQSLQGLRASQGPAAASACAQTGTGHKSTLCSETHAPLPPSTPHVFRSSNTSLRHPREAAENPGHNSYCPRGGGVSCPVGEASVQVADVCAGPSPGLSGSQGGMCSRLGGRRLGWKAGTVSLAVPGCSFLPLVQWVCVSFLVRRRRAACPPLWKWR